MKGRASAPVLHHKRSHVTALDAEGTLVLNRRIENNPERFLRIFGVLSPAPRLASPSRPPTAGAGSPTCSLMPVSRRTWPIRWRPTRSPQSDRRGAEAHRRRRRRGGAARARAARRLRQRAAHRAVATHSRNRLHHGQWEVRILQPSRDWTLIHSGSAKRANGNQLAIRSPGLLRAS